MERIGLADAVALLRAEIEEAIDTSSRSPMFRMRSVELELAVYAQESSEHEGGLGWHLLTAKTARGSQQEVHHVVRFTLEIADDVDVQIGDA